MNPFKTQRAPQKLLAMILVGQGQGLVFRVHSMFPMLVTAVVFLVFAGTPRTRSFFGGSVHSGSLYAESVDCI